MLLWFQSRLEHRKITVTSELIWTGTGIDWKFYLQKNKTIDLSKIDELEFDEYIGQNLGKENLN